MPESAKFEPEPTNLSDRFVDQVVIQSDCPVEPCASESWLKIRAISVAFISSIPGQLLMLLGYGTPGLIIASGALCISIRLIATRIDQRIEQGHICE